MPAPVAARTARTIILRIPGRLITESRRAGIPSCLPGVVAHQAARERESLEGKYDRTGSLGVEGSTNHIAAQKEDEEAHLERVLWYFLSLALSSTMRAPDVGSRALEPPTSLASQKQEEEELPPSGPRESSL